MESWNPKKALWNMHSHRLREVLLTSADVKPSRGGLKCMHTPSKIKRAAEIILDALKNARADAFSEQSENQTSHTKERYDLQELEITWY